LLAIPADTRPQQEEEKEEEEEEEERMKLAPN
jgi:hypothetical protein